MIRPEDCCHADCGDPQCQYSPIEYTTVKAAQMGDLPFWDEALAGQSCFVDCFPSEDGVDCRAETAIVGVMGSDGVFRSPSWKFMPSADVWHCSIHIGRARVIRGFGEDGRGWRPLDVTAINRADARLRELEAQEPR